MNDIIHHLKPLYKKRANYLLLSGLKKLLQKILYSRRQDKKESSQFYINIVNKLDEIGILLKKIKINK